MSSKEHLAYKYRYSKGIVSEKSKGNIIVIYCQLKTLMKQIYLSKYVLENEWYRVFKHYDVGLNYGRTKEIM